jgi:Ni,Fe-hydrogenase III large subunit
MDFRKMTREFLMGEGKDVSVHSHVQSLMDILSSMRFSTKIGGRRAEMAKMHLQEIRKTVRRLEENVRKLEEQTVMLEDQLRVLEEGSSDE